MMRQKRAESRNICLRRASCQCQCQLMKLRKGSSKSLNRDKRFGATNVNWIAALARGQGFPKRIERAHLAAEVRVGTPSFA
jgi:hypothetical protein